jgi:signal transduction histidine kinase/ligand-binding sensor domain-containing protein
VRVVRAGRERGVWVGTASGLVGRVHGDDLVTASLDAPVEALLEARDGTLWAATAKRVVRLHPETLAQIGAAISLPADFYSGLVQDEDGAIWLSTTRGVEQIDPIRGEARPAVHLKGKLWLSQDRDGTIRVTTADGHSTTLKEQSAGQAAAGTSTLKMRTVLRDTSGSMWIGTLGKGLLRVRTGASDSPPERFSRADGLSNNNVWALFEDREHNLWIGTQDGLNCLRDGSITTLTRHNGEASGSIDALAAASGGAIWASTSAGLHRMDRDHAEIPPKGPQAKALLTDRDGNLWAATGNGIVRMTDGVWLPVPAQSRVRFSNVIAMADDDQRRLWIFDADLGLYRLSSDGLTNFANAPFLQGKSIVAMRGDNQGRMWFGLYQGGVVVFEGGQFRAYSERDGLASKSINAIAVDDKGTVWVGAERGLSRFDGIRFATWNSAQGLPGERVLWIIPAGAGRLWLGYTNGIVSVSTAELDRALRDSSQPVAHEFLDNGDGLKGNLDRGLQSAAVQAKDGAIWFTTSAGVAFVDPGHLPKNPLTPPVHIERMVADGALIDTKSAIRLRPFTRDVEFDYTALSLVEPRQVRFRYKLQGYDSDWQEAGARRQAFYTNLNPRVYQFRVMACNNDGLWNEAGAALDFELLPAFYQTQWFRALSLLVLMIFAWFAYRLRMRQVAARLRGRFEERLRERTRIAQELHDNLLQSVLGISLQIEVTDELLPPDLPAKGPLQKALSLSKSAMEEGRRALNELRASSLSADDIVGGFSEIADALRTEGGSDIHILVEGTEQPLNAVTGNDVLQIGRQAIANAYQHAHASRIRVLLSYSKRDLRVSVQDNGRGIDEDMIANGKPGHHGIRGMRERADRIGATLSISTNPGEGTEVDVSVPAKLVYQNNDDNRADL